MNHAKNRKKKKEETYFWQREFTFSNCDCPNADGAPVPDRPRELFNVFSLTLLVPAAATAANDTGPEVGVIELIPATVFIAGVVMTGGVVLRENTNVPCCFQKIKYISSRNCQVEKSGKKK